MSYGLPFWPRSVTRRYSRQVKRGCNLRAERGKLAGFHRLGDREYIVPSAGGTPVIRSSCTTPEICVGEYRSKRRSLNEPRSAFHDDRDRRCARFPLAVAAATVKPRLLGNSAPPVDALGRAVSLHAYIMGIIKQHQHQNHHIPHLSHPPIPPSTFHPHPRPFSLPYSPPFPFELSPCCCSSKLCFLTYSNTILSSSLSCWLFSPPTPPPRSNSSFVVPAK